MFICLCISKGGCTSYEVEYELESHSKSEDKSVLGLSIQNVSTKMD